MQLLEQAADMVLVVTDMELFLDDLSDAGTGPDSAADAVSLGPVPQELGDHALLLHRQSGPWTEPGMGQECAEPPSRARLTQRLTVSLVTPKASAMSHCTSLPASAPRHATGAIPSSRP